MKGFYARPAKNADSSTNLMLEMQITIFFLILIFRVWETGIPGQGIKHEKNYQKQY